MKDVKRNKNNNTWLDMFNFFLQYNTGNKSKGHLMEMAYEKNYSNVDSAIPQSLWDTVDNTAFFVYDYTDNSFGKLVDLRVKLKYSNAPVDIAIVVDDKKLLEGNKLPEELQGDLTFNKALTYVFNHDEVTAFDIRPKAVEKHAKGGEVADYNVIVRLPQKGLITKKDFEGMSKEEIIKWCEERGWSYNKEGEKFGGQALKDYEFFTKKVFAKGGGVDGITYKKVLEVLKDKIENAVEDVEFEGKDQNTGEEVEHKAMSGFIPFTNGGYQLSWYEALDTLNGMGKRLPTAPLNKEMERQIQIGYDFAQDKFKQTYPEIVAELGEENIDYNTLYENEYGSEAEELSSWENDYNDGQALMKIFAYYYNPTNDKGVDGKHTISLQGDVNLEAPYHREGNLDDFKEIVFTFDSISDLEKKMDSNLKTIVAWFNGAEFDESTREMKIRKMANGGEVNEGDKFTYMMLSRLQMDCDYFLGNGNGYEKHLWAGNVDGQIEEMKKLWNSLPESKKPQWLSMEDILDYESKMKNFEKADVKMARGGIVKTKDGVEVRKGSHEYTGHVFYDEKGVGYECLGYFPKLDDCMYKNLETGNEVVGCMDGFYFKNPTVKTKDGVTVKKGSDEYKGHIFYDEKGVGYECMGYFPKLDDCVYKNLETGNEVVGCMDGFYFENPAVNEQIRNKFIADLVAYEGNEFEVSDKLLGFISKIDLKDTKKPMKVIYDALEGYEGEDFYVSDGLLGFIKESNDVVFAKGGSVTTNKLNSFIAEINQDGGGEFSLGGAYGYYELWARDKDGGSHRVEVGSRKDIYEALIKNRYNKKYNPKYADEKFATGGGVGDEHKAILALIESASIINNDILAKYDIVKEAIKDWKVKNAEQVAKTRKKELEQSGYSVKLKKWNFDSGFSYSVTAIKPKIAIIKEEADYKIIIKGRGELYEGDNLDKAKELFYAYTEANPEKEVSIVNENDEVLVEFVDGQERVGTLFMKMGGEFMPQRLSMERIKKLVGKEPDYPYQEYRGHVYFKKHFSKFYFLITE